jgi:hypothetical protein
MSGPNVGNLTEEKIKEAVATWQRRELRRFGSKLPPLLQPLARELGIEAKDMAPQEQAMLEDGWWSDGVHWVGHASPVSADDLRAKKPEDAVEYVTAWKAPDDGSEQDIHGLLQALRTAVTADVHWGASVAIEAVRGSSLLVRTAALEGLRDAAQSRDQASEQSHSDSKPFPWGVAFSVVSDAFSVAETVSDGVIGVSLRAYLEVSIDILTLTATGDVLREHGETVRRLLVTGRKLRATWLAESATKIEDVEGILLASLNTLSGRLVRATLNVGLTDARLAREKNGATDSTAPSHIGREVGAALDDFLAEGTKGTAKGNPFSPAGYGALGMMGEYAPQIAYLAPGWLRQNIETLFANVGSPLSGPGWASYITRAGFYDSVFSLAKSYYREAALAASPDEEQEGRWSTSEGLAQHVLISVLRGRSEVQPNVDELVVLTFSRVPPASRSHAYWEIYRAWEDHDAPISDKLVNNALSFWGWRLNELERVDASAGRATEAEGLLWFFLTRRVPANRSLDLAMRTLKLLGKRATANLSLLERLATLADEFPAGAYNVAEVAVSLALASDYPYVPKEPLFVVLRAALKSPDDDVADRATRLVHKLGDVTGDTSFGDLLPQS